MKKLARVVVKPRDKKSLELSLADARAAIKLGFGKLKVKVSDVVVEDKAWKANVTIESDEALLVNNADDERLWCTFIESGFTGGSLTVVEISPASPR
jgi:hypothetical protein